MGVIVAHLKWQIFPASCTTQQAHDGDNIFHESCLRIRVMPNAFLILTQNGKPF